VRLGKVDGDEQALHDHLRQLLQSETLRDELGKAGRQHILTNYTQRQIADKTVAVYREMMAN